jgi:hypothetical protein
MNPERKRTAYPLKSKDLVGTGMNRSFADERGPPCHYRLPFQGRRAAVGVPKLQVRAPLANAHESTFNEQRDKSHEV